jgi:hypothetical protein
VLKDKKARVLSDLEKIEAIQQGLVDRLESETEDEEQRPRKRPKVNELKTQDKIITVTISEYNPDEED